MVWRDIGPELDRLHRFLDLAVRGLQAALHAKESVDLNRRIALELNDPDPFPTEEEFQNALEAAADLEAFATEQSDSGFSYIYELGVVKLWSVLENAIDQLALERLADPAVREREPITTLEGPLLQFAGATADEQAEFLLSKLKILVKASLQRGAGRFEALLNAVGLGGPVDDAVARALVDLSESRHVIVHRGGIADKQFVSRCPWNPVAVGQKLRITQREFNWHHFAAEWYALEVDARFKTIRTENRPPSHQELQRAVLDSLRKFDPGAAG
jgi:hypothetical protein